MHAVAVVGASGYTGAELLRLVAGHPHLDAVVATGDTMAGTPVGDLYPGLAPAYGDLVFTPFTTDDLAEVDVAFCGLPHGAVQELAYDLVDHVDHVVDLSADFRFDDASVYDQWYGSAHKVPELLDRFVYGLPERDRDELRDAAAVAVPGCYPTAATLALAPLVDAGLVETDGIVVDAASGVSGAGRALKTGTQFCTVDEDFRAYGLLDHRHTPEIERNLGATVLFTPHLAPMNRGILATCYARPAGPVTTDLLTDVLTAAYGHEPFVHVTTEPPSTKATLGSNAAHVTARADDRTGWIVALCAIDNLGKGAAGQAVQCANLALGLDETAGLTATGTAP